MRGATGGRIATRPVASHEPCLMPSPYRLPNRVSPANGRRPLNLAARAPTTFLPAVAGQRWAGGRGFGRRWTRTPGAEQQPPSSSVTIYHNAPPPGRLPPRFLTATTGLDLTPYSSPASHCLTGRWAVVLPLPTQHALPIVRCTGAQQGIGR